MKHLDEIGPAGLLGDFGGLAGLGGCDLLEQVSIICVLHNNAQSGGAVLHEALFVHDDVRVLD